MQSYRKLSLFTGFLPLVCGLALVLGLFGPRAEVMADTLDDRRCDWADCGNSSPTPKASSAAPATNLSICDHQDDLDCKDKCRQLFDSEFTRCLKSCKKERCSDPEEQIRESSAAREAGLECIELESKSCEKECSSQSGAAQQARCRMSCLQRQCPSASRLEMTKESADPGSMKCERCRNNAKQDCADTCGIAVVTGPLTGRPGLEQLGCVKLCLMSTCGESCGTRIPFMGP